MQTHVIMVLVFFVIGMAQAAEPEGAKPWNATAQALLLEIKSTPKINAEFWRKVRRWKPLEADDTHIAVYQAGNRTYIFTYRNVEGLAVADRDIVLGPFDEVRAQQALIQGEGPVGFALAVVTPRLGERWPGGVVPYEFAEDFDARDEVEAAIRRFESATPVNFRRRNGEQNFVRFVPQMTWPYLSSMSPIGKTGNRQDVKIQTRQRENTEIKKEFGLIVASVLHELGHTLGFAHEHNRPDRDEWVVYDPDCADFWYAVSGNYAIEEGFTQIGPYDYTSIMHYGSRAGEKGPPWDRKACFDLVKHPDKRAEGDATGVISSTFDLSRHDINALHHMYGRGPLVNEAGDRYGQTLLSFDFDGDGYEDLAVGAPSQSIDGQANTGVVALYKGTASGFVLWKRLRPDLPALENLPADQRPTYGGQRFGWSLAAGDFNNDGVMDLAVGAPWESHRGKIAVGAVYVFSIRGNKKVENWLRIHKPVDDPQHPYEAMDRFGHALAAGRFVIVDDDKIRMSHLAIGSPGARDGEAGRTGRVWAMTRVGFAPIHHEPVAPGSQPLLKHGQFGYALATMPRHDPFVRSSVDDLAIGAPGFTWAECPETSAYVARAIGGTGQQISIRQRLARPDTEGMVSFCPHDLEAGGEIDSYPPVWQANFGAALASADFDGDGFPELAVGQVYETNQTPEGRGGRVYIYAAAEGSTVLEHRQTIGQGRLDTTRAGDMFGWSLAAGDLNQDGKSDLLVGAPFDKRAGGAPGSGDAFVYLGCRGLSLRSGWTPPPGLLDFARTRPSLMLPYERSLICGGLLKPQLKFDQAGAGANEVGDQFGFALATGRFSNQKHRDIAVGAPGEAPGQEPKSGFVFRFRFGDAMGPQDGVSQEFTTKFSRPD